jgi:hypothetical protein
MEIDEVVLAYLKAKGFNSAAAEFEKVTYHP